MKEQFQYQPVELIRPPLYGKNANTQPIPRNIGPISLREDIQSTDGPYPYLPEYQEIYPPKVIQALENLYTEYNTAFTPLVTANREWESDYQYATTPDGLLINRWIQVDMVGLTEEFLEAAPTLGIEEIEKTLRGRIFELENNLACYQETMFMFSRDNHPSQFEREFRVSLDRVRQQYGKPIALLATTEEKYIALKQEELGKAEQETVMDVEIQLLTGFDRLFSPMEFEHYITENNGECDYLLYVRSSDPVAKLRNPNIPVDNPLLANNKMRKIIRANAVTFNIDNPNQDAHDASIIDTKMYLQAMGMAFPITDVGQFDSEEFSAFLRMQGITPEQINREQLYFRAKPASRSYGCYGQDRGQLTDPKFLTRLRKSLLQRGIYVIQPEMQIPLIVDEREREYAYMDRVYLTTDGQNYRFMGGCRYFMPTDSTEYRRGRIHGNDNAVLGEIIM